MIESFETVYKTPLKINVIASENISSNLENGMLTYLLLTCNLLSNFIRRQKNLLDSRMLP